MRNNIISLQKIFFDFCLSISCLVTIWSKSKEIILFLNYLGIYFLAHEGICVCTLLCKLPKMSRKFWKFFHISLLRPNGQWTMCFVSCIQNMYTHKILSFCIVQITKKAIKIDNRLLVCFKLSKPHIFMKYK